MSDNWIRSTYSKHVWFHREDRRWRILDVTEFSKMNDENVTHDYVVDHASQPFPRSTIPSLEEAMALGDKLYEEWKAIWQTLAPSIISNSD